MDSKEVEQTRADMPAPAPYNGPDTADWLERAALRGVPDTHPKYPVPDDPIHPNHVEPWTPGAGS